MAPLRALDHVCEFAVPRFITGDFISLAYTIGLLVVVAGILFALYRVFIQAISTVVLWVLVGLTLVTTYSYRSELHNVGRQLFAEVLPAHALSHGAIVRAVRTSAGDFAVNAEINEAPVKLAFDTHARLVVLTRNDAKAAGLPVEMLRYTVDIETANGQARAAPVTLERMAIGSIVERSVDAVVVQSGQLKSSLLGMSFLDRLQDWEMRDDKLFLREASPNPPPPPA